jgi:hypothetical protein
MKRIAAMLLAVVAAPALAQSPPSTTEQVETPQGTVTIVRPPPRAQPYTPGPQVNPDPVPPPPQTPFLTDQREGRSPVGPYGEPLPAPYAAPYSPYVVINPPPVIIIQRRGVPAQTTAPRRIDDVGPVPPLVPYTPGAAMQPRDGFGRSLPSPRYPPNQYGPGAVPGTVPLPDAADVIILRR